MNLWSSESVEGAPRCVRGNTVTTLKTQRVNTNTLWGDNREALMFCFVCCHGNMCVTAPQPLIIITDRILSKPTNTAPDCSRMCEENKSKINLRFSTSWIKESKNKVRALLWLYYMNWTPAGAGCSGLCTCPCLSSDSSSEDPTDAAPSALCWAVSTAAAPIFSYMCSLCPLTAARGDSTCVTAATSRQHAHPLTSPAELH